MNRKQPRAQAKVDRNPRAGADYLASAIRDHQAGRLAEAEANYRQALAIDPNYAEVMFNFAVVLRQQGKLDEAAEAYRATVALAPDHAEAHYNLGNLLLQQGEADAAINCYRAAIGHAPDHAGAHCNLGLALKAQGKFDDAVAALRRATALKPDDANGHLNLADAQVALGKLDDAIASYRAAVRIDPRNAVACYNLGNALHQQGKVEEAADAYARAVALKPDWYEAQVNLGNALCALGRFDAGVAAYRRAIAATPAEAAAHFNLGNALKDHGRFEAAAAAYRQAIAVAPGHGQAHGNLAIVLTAQGKLDEALAEYRHAIALAPDDAAIHSNDLLCLHYSDRETAETLFAAHREWGRRHGRPPPDDAYANDLTPHRRLRIGYVSPDLRAHSVAYFVEPLLRNHDKRAVEIFCYADVLRPDATTARLRALADRWLSTVGLSDEALARQIRADRIDILVDLAGHTAWNRLPVFARKPAPLQVTWLGYPDTTGLAAIDYRLVDAVTDPVGAADDFSAETLLRLDGGFLCYGGAPDAPEPAPPPSLASGAVTFGSFNNLAKLSPATLAVWAKLLARLPQARLLLKARPFADAETRAQFLRKLAACGVAESRVELVGWAADSASHLALYSRVDIALDPLPYNGTTTTCEALWMGVPVVSLRGDRHSARVGASVLGQAGLGDWIADTADDYVAIAAALAENPARLGEWRRSLRSRLAASPLCDGAGFARKMERCYREIWRRRCETGSRAGGNVA